MGDLWYTFKKRKAMFLRGLVESQFTSFEVGGETYTMRFGVSASARSPGYSIIVTNHTSTWICEGDAPHIERLKNELNAGITMTTDNVGRTLRGMLEEVGENGPTTITAQTRGEQFHISMAKLLSSCYNFRW
jgi:hypothetical protein